MSRQPISVLVTPTKSGGSICALLGSLLRCFDGVLPSQIVLVLPDDQDSMVLQQRLLELSAAGIELAIIRINEQKPQDAPRWRAMAWAECRYETAVFLEDNTIVEHGWWQAVIWPHLLPAVWSRLIWIGLAGQRLVFFTANMALFCLPEIRASHGL
jgi:hypothetical protein